LSQILDRFGIEAVYRQEADRVLATLIRLLGDFELAEEARQDAFEAALGQWGDGLPDNPRAWLVNAGRHKAIDRVRRRIALRGKVAQLRAEQLSDAQAAPLETAEIADDQLRLIFTCCHPALGLEAQVALTLRVICGLTPQTIARVFLISETTLAQRLVRAKAKIREAGIPYIVPPLETLDERVSSVLAVLYLVFTSGYAPAEGEEPLGRAVCDEAIRLGRLLVELLPGRAPVEGLLALMLLHHARFDSRISAEGELLLLEEQDRARWDRGRIDEAARLLDTALARGGLPDPHVVEAAIAALHAQAPSFAETDWRQIAGLYHVLLRLRPSPVVELNAAAALSMVDGPARALELIDALAARGELGGYYLLPAARADLLRRLRREAEAQAEYDRAIALADSEAVRQLLRRRRMAAC
jgi:RNA polymerase sigma-70 factor, ECF subfamily